MPFVRCGVTSRAPGHTTLSQTSCKAQPSRSLFLRSRSLLSYVIRSQSLHQTPPVMSQCPPRCKAPSQAQPQRGKHHPRTQRVMRGASPPRWFGSHHDVTTRLVQDPGVRVARPSKCLLACAAAGRDRRHRGSIRERVAWAATSATLGQSTVAPTQQHISNSALRLSLGALHQPCRPGVPPGAGSPGRPCQGRERVGVVDDPDRVGLAVDGRIGERQSGDDGVCGAESGLE